MMNKYFFYLIIFFSFFGPKRGAYLDLINFISIFVILLGFRHLYFKEFERIFIFLCLILMLHFQIIILLNGSTYDVWHFFQIPRLIINTFAAIVLVRYSIENNIDLLRVISGCITFHALFVILGSAIPEIKFITYDITGMVDKSPIRFAGLTNSYAIPSIMHFIGIAIILLSEQTKNSSLYNALMIVILLVSQVFLARIGLVFSMSFLALYFLVKMRFAQRAYSIIIGIIFIYMLNYEILFPEEIVQAFKYSSEIFLLLGQADQIGSLQTIQDFSFHNQTFFEIIFGTGHYGRGNDFFHLYTDISWAHYFSLAGVLGILLIVAIYTVPFLYMRSSIILNFVIASTILISNYKEAFIFVRGLSMIWLLILIYSIYKSPNRFNYQND